MTASNAQRIHEQRSNAARYSSNRVACASAETKLTRCVYTVRLHARCTFTRSAAHAYRTSGGRVISVLRSFFSPPSQRSTIVFFKRNVNFLLTATVQHVTSKVYQNKMLGARHITPKVTTPTTTTTCTTDSAYLDEHCPALPLHSSQCDPQTAKTNSSAFQPHCRWEINHV